MLPGYSTEIGITINAPPAGLPAGTVIKCTQFETRALAAAGSCRPDRKDFRLLYNGAEIDRVMLNTGTFVFRLQATLSANAVSTEYVVDYGNPTESTSPKENPKNVWVSYYNGSDLASLTTTGSVSTINIARANFLKAGVGSVIKREPNTSTQAALREVELYWDGSYFWATADPVGSFTVGLPPKIAMWRSTDLLNWDRRPDIDGLGDLIIHDPYNNGSLVGTYITGSGNFQGPIGMPPYTLTFATASNPEGPWTLNVSQLPLGSSSLDDIYNVDGHLFTPNGGTSWYLFYGGAGSATGVTTALASSSSPTGPWTKLGAITPWGQGENPRFLNVPSENRSYLISNLVGGAQGEGYTRSNTLRESTAWNSGVSFNSSYVLTVLEPGDPGEWDDFAIGLMGMPVIKDGMIYMTYDASNTAEVFASPYLNARAHMYRDGGLAETSFPFARTTGINLGFGATVSTPTMIQSNADGEIRIRCTASLVEIKGATTSVSIDGGSADEFGGASFGLTVNGTPTAPITNIDNNVDGNGIARTQTFMFRRSNGTLKAYIESILFWQGASTEALYLKITGGGLIEEMWATNTPVSLLEPISIFPPLGSLALSGLQNTISIEQVVIPFAPPTGSVVLSALTSLVSIEQAGSGIYSAFGDVLPLRIYNSVSFQDGILRIFDGSIFK